jgi:hypothetical protein
VVSSQRSFPRLQTLPFFSPWSRWQHPQWWDLQLRDNNHPRFWIFHPRHHTYARALWYSHLHINPEMCLPQQLRIPSQFAVQVLLHHSLPPAKHRWCVWPTILVSIQQGGKIDLLLLDWTVQAAFVMILSLQTTNTAGHTKKVVTNAVLFLGYCTGNIAGPFFYRTDQSPSYPLGIWSMIVSHLLEVVIILTLRFLLARDSRSRDHIQGISGQESEDEKLLHLERWNGSWASN